MEPAIHRFHDLFAQLGLPNDAQAIAQFMAQHTPLPDGLPLADAPFWTHAQASFLLEALDQDSDWSELVDHLSEALRGPRMSS